jgi:hypothetical protein
MNPEILALMPSQSPLQLQCSDFCKTASGAVISSGGGTHPGAAIRLGTVDQDRPGPMVLLL